MGKAHGRSLRTVLWSTSNIKVSIRNSLFLKYTRVLRSRIPSFKALILQHSLVLQISISRYPCIVRGPVSIMISLIVHLPPKREQFLLFRINPCKASLNKKNLSVRFSLRKKLLADDKKNILWSFWYRFNIWSVMHLVVTTVGTGCCCWLRTATGFSIQSDDVIID